MGPVTATVLSVSPANLRPLITEQRQVDQAPSRVAPCDGGSADGSIPFTESHETDDETSYATSAEVLQSFFARHETFSDGDWVEMIEPDGSITYGLGPGNPDAWIALISITQEPSGWKLKGWLASGC